MKNVFLIGALIGSLGFISSARADETNNVRGILGFSQGALTFGADYERRLDSVLGVGGYFQFSSEQKDNVSKNQTISFGALAPLHLLDDARFDVFMAPGVGITMVKGLYGANDETMIGPMMKTDLQYKFTPGVRAGLEYVYLANWFSTKLPASYRFTNAVVTFIF